MEKVLVIGAGGIGSFFIDQLIMLKHQWNGKVTLTVIDPDSIEEKNIKYQNFAIEDILESKSDIISKKYGIIGLDDKITESSDLSEYSMFVLCVDNNKVRNLIAKHCYSNDIKFIDLRAEGRSVMVLTSSLSEDKYLDMTEDDGGEGGSCQLKFELEKGIIQNGNKIIAAIGAQYFVDMIRGEENQAEFIHRF